MAKMAWRVAMAKLAWRLAMAKGGDLDLLVIVENWGMSSGTPSMEESAFICKCGGALVLHVCLFLVFACLSVFQFLHVGKLVG